MHVTVEGEWVRTCLPYLQVAPLSDQAAFWQAYVAIQHGFTGDVIVWLEDREEGSE